MKKDKLYTKPYRIFQISLFIIIILAYVLFLIFGNGEPLGGLLPVELVHFVVVLILIMQIQTLLDIYKKLNKKLELVLNIVVATYAGFLALLFYMTNIHLGFTIVLAIISLSMVVNVYAYFKSKQ
ncbi:MULTISPECIES: hypothetical protein [Bacillaceae]|uniref:Uncharacterized protein n=1 Tax=Evansella alkalicola TaxID=745819 RepID=A0ABS6JYQ2_9BACI|nr:MULTISPECIES: hypothetical protein [Bacillaceae]MBU9723729.1 hypothetical protein [Bacillus alkalicola]